MEERRGENGEFTSNLQEAKQFNNFIEGMMLVEPPFAGRMYTWFRWGWALVVS